MTHITKSVCLSYLCRQKNCGFYGYNHQWLKHISHEWFKCPACGARYYPWQMTDQTWPANRLLSLPDCNGKRVAVPILWPSTEEDRWFNRQIEAYAETVGLIDKKDARPFIRRSVHEIQALMDASGIPAAFTKRTWNKDIEWRLGPNYPLEQYQDIIQNGFFGDFVDLSNPLLPAPMQDLGQIIALLGNLLAGVKAASVLE